MRALIGGTVAKVTERSYVTNGNRNTVADVYVGDAPYFDKVTMPLDLAPTVGEEVQYVANIRAKSVLAKASGERHTFLDVWCVERIHTPAVRAVS